MNDYISFINKSDNLTNCQKKILINLKNNLNKNYVNASSNKQIKTCVNLFNKNDDISNLCKFELLFNNFVSSNVSKKIIKYVSHNNVSDTEVIKFIKENEVKKYNNKKDIYNICSSWKYIIENVILTYKSIITKLNNNEDIDNIINNIKYLDIGCGGGHKTSLIGKELKLKKENMNGTDIKKWGPYSQENTKYDFNFKFIKDDGTLDYKDNSFDIITCILMLHHVKELDNILVEIKRILKPNGIILIIEHDNHTDSDNMTLDILHLLYGYLVDKTENYIDNPDYSRYYNWCEWDYIFDKHEFSYIKSNYLFTSISHKLRYDNIYYCFYKNIK